MTPNKMPYDGGENWLLDTDIPVGAFNGNPLYLYITEGTIKNNEGYKAIKQNFPFTGTQFVKADFVCINSTNSNMVQPYYVSSSDMFRAAIESSNGGESNAYLSAQIGTSYPAGGTSGAKVRAFIYHT